MERMNPKEIRLRPDGRNWNVELPTYAGDEVAAFTASPDEIEAIVRELLNLPPMRSDRSSRAPFLVTDFEEMHAMFAEVSGELPVFTIEDVGPEGRAETPGGYSISNGLAMAVALRMNMEVFLPEELLKPHQQVNTGEMSEEGLDTYIAALMMGAHWNEAAALAGVSPEHVQELRRQARDEGQPGFQRCVFAEMEIGMNASRQSGKRARRMLETVKERRLTPGEALEAIMVLPQLEATVIHQAAANPDAGLNDLVTELLQDFPPGEPALSLDEAKRLMDMWYDVRSDRERIKGLSKEETYELYQSVQSANQPAGPEIMLLYRIRPGD